MKFMRVFFRTMLCSILPLCLLLNCMGLSAVAATSKFDGYLYNGDFETGEASEWTLGEGEIVSLDGDYALKATSTSRYNMVAEQIITVKANTDYTLTLKTKYVGAHDSAQARVHVYKGAEGTSEALTGSYYWYTGANVWENNQMSFNPGENTQVRIVLQQHAAPSTSTAMDGNLYYDDFVVAEKATGYQGSAPKDKSEGANLRIMSYNVLVDNDETLGGWSWGQPLGTRGDKASACIEYYQPDVIGFQECNYKWHVSLRENLPDYDFVNADVPEKMPLEAKESLGKKDWMCTTMMYNTKTLTLIDNELIGYSVNYWGCIQRMRYLSMAVFEIKATGERFIFTSTHTDAEKDDKGKKNRVTQMTEMRDRLNYYKTVYGYPIISTGDYNSGYSDDPIQVLVQGAGMTSHTSNRGGIDYVLYSEGVEGKYFTVINDADVRGASDHQPVFLDANLTNFRFAEGNLASGGQTSRMEMSEYRLGLAFEFSLAAKGVVKGSDYVADITNATVDTLNTGNGFKLLGMGAIVSNDAAIGNDPDKMTMDNLSGSTIAINAEYVSAVTADTATYAVRVTNIPKEMQDVVIYARPYYTYECDGEIVTRYGEIVADNYIGKIDVNDGVLEW